MYLFIYEASLPPSNVHTHIFQPFSKQNLGSTEFARGLSFISIWGPCDINPKKKIKTKRREDFPQKFSDGVFLPPLRQFKSWDIRSEKTLSSLRILGEIRNKKKNKNLYTQK